MSEEIIFAMVVGLVLGAAVSWIWATARFRAREGVLQQQVRTDSEQKVELQSRLSQLETDLRRQIGKLESNLTERDQQIGTLQQEIRKEGESRAAAETRAAGLESTLTSEREGNSQLRAANDLLQQELAAIRLESNTAETRLADVQIRLSEQSDFIQKTHVQIKESFQSLAADALRTNSADFFKNAASTFEKVQLQSKGDLDTHKLAVEAMMNPLKELLGRYEIELQKMEGTRVGAYVDLKGRLEGLQSVTNSLNMAMHGMHAAVRGRWGELTLRRAAELAGMVEHCDFDLQESFQSETGTQRPDMIVNYPGSVRIPVDAKVPIRAFLDAANAKSDEERNSHLAQHGQLVRNHMNDLADRRYQDLFAPAPQLVVLFLPGESFLAAALERDTDLFEDSLRKGVLLAGPTNLIGLLLAVAHGWKQESIAKFAQEISEIGSQLYDRIRTFVEHMDRTGAALRGAMDNHNKAIGSLKSRVLVSARRLKELGSASGDDIPTIEEIDVVIKQVSGPETEPSDKNDLA